VLSTPPAFVLSQNQTLQTKTNPHPKAQAEFESEQVRPNKKTPKTGINKTKATPPTREVTDMTQKNNNKNKNHQTHY
jgi:hypothetical protein